MDFTALSPFPSENVSVSDTYYSLGSDCITIRRYIPSHLETDLVRLAQDRTPSNEPVFFFENYYDGNLALLLCNDPDPDVADQAELTDISVTVDHEEYVPAVNHGYMLIAGPFDAGCRIILSKAPFEEKEAEEPEEALIDEDTLDQAIAEEETPDQELIEEDTPDEELISEDTPDQELIEKNTPEEESLERNTPDEELIDEDEIEEDAYEDLLRVDGISAEESDNNGLTDDEVSEEKKQDNCEEELSDNVLPDDNEGNLSAPDSADDDIDEAVDTDACENEDTDTGEEADENEDLDTDEYVDENEDIDTDEDTDEDVENEDSDEDTVEEPGPVAPAPGFSHTYEDAEILYSQSKRRYVLKIRNGNGAHAILPDGTEIFARSGEQAFKGYRMRIGEEEYDLVVMKEEAVSDRAAGCNAYMPLLGSFQGDCCYCVDTSHPAVRHLLTVKQVINGTRLLRVATNSNWKTDLTMFMQFLPHRKGISPVKKISVKSAEVS